MNVIYKAVGQISESDVTLAAASDAIIIAFQVRPSAQARRLAEQEGVDIRQYSVIYDAIEEVKDAMEGMLSPEIKEEITAQVEVRQVYHISKVGTVAGAYVIDGKVSRTNKARVIRDGIVIFTGAINALKRFKDDVKEVTTNFECGISLVNYNDLREGDIIETFAEVEVKAKLKKLPHIRNHTLMQEAFGEINKYIESIPLSLTEWIALLLLLYVAIMGLKYGFL